MCPSSPQLASVSAVSLRSRRFFGWTCCLAEGVAVAGAPAGAAVRGEGGRRFDAAVYPPQARSFPQEFGIPRKKQAGGAEVGKSWSDRVRQPADASTRQMGAAHPDTRHQAGETRTPGCPPSDLGPPENARVPSRSTTATSRRSPKEQTLMTGRRSRMLCQMTQATSHDVP